MYDAFIDRIIQSGQADSIAILDDYGIYTYKTFRNAVHAYQETIRNLEVPIGSRIILFLPNGMRAIAMLFAIISSGMIAVPVSIDTPADALYHIQAKTGAIATVMLQNNLQLRIERHRTTIENDSHTEHGCLILFTSGTTGYLKGAELSSRALLATVEAVVDYMHTGRHDRFYIIKDYVHCSSLIAEIFVALYSGASICLFNPRVHITLTRKNILEFKPTIMGINPWFLELICKQKKFRNYYDSLQIVASSGAVLSEGLAERAKAFFRNADVINVYGLTEAGSRVCAQLPFAIHGDNSVGKPITGIEVKVQKRNKDEPDGEVLVKTPGIMLRYYNDPIATREKVWNGWLKTGDYGYFNEAGNLVITGRIDDVIVSGANKIDPVRVANVIKRCPGIFDAVVIGVPQELIGEVVVALVVCEGEFDSEKRAAIDCYCRERLYSYECPRRFISVQQLPRTFSGKISKASICGLVEDMIHKE